MQLIRNTTTGEAVAWGDESANSRLVPDTGQELVTVADTSREQFDERVKAEAKRRGRPDGKAGKVFFVGGPGRETLTVEPPIPPAAEPTMTEVVEHLSATRQPSDTITMAELTMAYEKLKGPPRAREGH